MDTSTTESNRALIRAAFEAWQATDSNRDFFKLVAQDVHWTVIGTTPISGTYTSKKAFLAGATGLLTARFAAPLKLTRIVAVLADGDRVDVQFESASQSVNGVAYNQTYCWALRLVAGQVVEATAYLDTELVTAMFA